MSFCTQMDNANAVSNCIRRLKLAYRLGKVGLSLELQYKDLNPPVPLKSF